VSRNDLRGDPARRGPARISLRGFFKSLSEALRTACVVLMLIACSTVLGHLLAVTRIPMKIGVAKIMKPRSSRKEPPSS